MSSNHAIVPLVSGAKALTQRAQRKDAKDATVTVAKLEVLPLRPLRQGFCNTPQWNDGGGVDTRPSFVGYLLVETYDRHEVRREA